MLGNQAPGRYPGVRRRARHHFEPRFPLKGFLTVVAANTDLLKPDTSAAGRLGRARQGARCQFGRPEEGPGGAAEGAAQPGAKVTAYFEPIGPGGRPAGQAPIDQMLASLQQQSRRLQTTGSGVGQQSALDPAVQAAVADAKRLARSDGQANAGAPGQHRVGSGVA